MADDEKLLAHLKWMTTELRQARRRIADLEERAQEPVAIVGMGCRFPGDVRSPGDLWRLLAEGTDAIGDFPADRGWLDDGKGYRRQGGFIADAHEFDADLFGISPREATVMDPQQRLLLEVAWETFETAGVSPRSLRGSRTGVFMGTNGQDYSLLALASAESAEGHVATGTSASVISGRLAYAYGLEGPAVTVDTACSSSLVALHLAVQALRNGECELALAGGVSVMSTVEVFAEFDRQGGLAADGRCKAFAAAADGTGWGEGVGVLLVERLSDAQRLGHEVLAVIRGSAVNQDGASNGLTAPNGPSQERVIRQALAAARLAPSEVDAVETHGTGTRLGDPIEAQALLATYGQDRKTPLWIGAVKSNIGHTQAAAGVAGVIKMVEAIRHGTLPATLHVDAPTPHVDWSAGAVELLTEARPWPLTGSPRRAGVSSFGMSGTNVHVVLEQAPEAPAQLESQALPAVPWVLSAKNAEGLRAQAARLAEWAASSGADAVSVGAALVRSRATLEHRAVIVGDDRAALVEGLAAAAAGMPAAGVLQGAAGAATEVVWVFPGQGAQWAGMTRALMAESPVFAESMAECDRALSEFVAWSLLDVPDEDLARVDVVQPVLWAVMVSLAAVWRSWGVEPAAVIGHSQGEIAAAVVAGALSLEDGARVVALRSRALAEIAGGGGMVSVMLPEAEARELLPEGVSVAVVNGPASIVVSGPAAALDELLERCAGAGARARRVAVDYASHSPEMERLRDRLLADLAPVTPRTAHTPVISTLTGAPVDGTAMDAGYWFENLRRTVRFQDAVEHAAQSGHRVFVEVSPHPVLLPAIEETVEAVTAVGSLRRDDGGLARLLKSAGELFTRGVDVDWPAVFAGTPSRRVELPTYAFQRQRYWLTPKQSAGDPVERAFWDAVESADVETLAAQLDVEAPALTPVLPALASWHGRRRTDSVLDGWRYRVTWKRLGELPAGRLDGTWLVVTAEDGLLGDVAAAVERRGGKTVRLVLPLADRRATAGHIAEAVGTTPITGVISLVALATEVYPARPLLLVQALADAGVVAPVWWATRGAAADPAQAGTWGLGSVARMERPDQWGGLVDLPENLDDKALTRLTSVVAGDEDEVAIRPDGVFARRLARAPAAGRPVRSWSAADRTVLISGGTGALGGHVARWLADNGVGRVLLLNRRGTGAPGAADLVRQLGERGCLATVVACDLADRDALRGVLDEIPAEFPLGAVIHTAALLDDALIDSLTPAQMERVWRVKVQGARHLHELTAHLDLSAFVLFSSFAGTYGSVGQGNYAPANAALDALAHQRRALGLPATSIAWGHWAGAGIGGVAMEETLRRRGVRSMPPDRAIAALRRILDDDETSIIVTEADWHAPAEGAVPSLARDLVEVLPEAAPEQSVLLRQLREAPRPSWYGVLLEAVKANAAAVLGHARPDAVEEHRAFREAGFDSISAVEFRNRINAATGLSLPATLVFDRATPAALTEHLVERLSGEVSATDSILERLAQLEAGFAAMTDDERGAVEKGGEIAIRLERVLSQWSEPEKSQAELRLDSDEELFAFIDTKLGKSRAADQ
ncbi:type I polyketide synthase [Herbidospora mongoliensis]|uniref:type I polyketide synthase n=1 Tax=Herbidospora mongoliensis TaxID=688067 RepID=UPI000B088742|nr:type I polyketide synthase [Herbidospora mongoliensis]